jgi:hypothetical protein
MSLTGFIRRPDRAPLGSDDEVKLQLSTHFPGVKFRYEAEEPSAYGELRKHLSLFQRFWRHFFLWDVPYPRHSGDIQSPSGWAIEFRFVAGPSVPWIAATAYGRTAGLDATFERLEQATGWETYYPG